MWHRNANFPWVQIRTELRPVAAESGCPFSWVPTPVIPYFVSLKQLWSSFGLRVWWIVLSPHSDQAIYFVWLGTANAGKMTHWTITLKARPLFPSGPTISSTQISFCLPLLHHRYKSWERYLYAHTHTHTPLAGIKLREQIKRKKWYLGQELDWRRWLVRKGKLENRPLLLGPPDGGNSSYYPINYYLILFTCHKRQTRFFPPL